MFPGGPNPFKLQNAPGSQKTPLVLIHDGGGTTFAYFFLSSMKRDVWALHNPNYWDSKKWEGGLDEMARHYIVLIRNAGVRGRIYLGGWSLGGLLSVIISRMVADDPTALFSVAGTILIDSPYHVPQSRLDTVIDPDLGDLPALVKACFDQCNDYLDVWELPTFDAPTKGGKLVTAWAGGRSHNVAPGQVLHLPLDGKWTTRTVQNHEFPAAAEGQKKKKLEPPPGVMLRALNKAPRPAGAETDCTIDMFRDEPLLGWEARYADFIKATIDIDSAHFDMFEKNNDKRIEHISNRVNQALEILDTLRVDM